MERNARRQWVIVVMLVICLPGIFNGARAQSEELTALSRRVTELYNAGKYAEAVPLAEKVLELARSQYGAEHPKVAEALNDLAVLYYQKGSYADAETYYKRAVAMFGRTVGEEHPDYADTIVSLGLLLQQIGRYGEAEPLFQQGIAIFEKVLGPDNTRLGRALATLGQLYAGQSRYNEAQPLFERALKIDEKALGPDSANVGIALNNLAMVYKAKGRFSDAEQVLERCISVTSKTLGPDNPELAAIINNRAEIARVQGHLAEAEPLYKRSLSIREKALGPEHIDVANSLNDLAVLYEEEERFKEAELLYQRALAINKKALGPDHPRVANVINSLAHLYSRTGRSMDIEALYKSALAIREKALGPDHPDVAQSLNNLAAFYDDHGRQGEAEPLYLRSLAIKEKTLGPDHPDYAVALNNLGGLYQAQGRTAEAEQLYKRSLAVNEKTLGPDHPELGIPLNNLAAIYFEKSRWQDALDYWRRSTKLLTERSRGGADNVGSALTGRAQSDALRSGWQFWGLVKAGYRLATSQSDQESALANEMFEAAQQIQGSEAAASLAQMSARGALGNAALAAIVRERPDLVLEWQTRDAARTTAISLPPDRRQASTEAAEFVRLSAIDTRIAGIDQKLAKDFADYAALANPAPLSLAAVQSDLRDDEALVLFLATPDSKPTPEETFIWVVTKSGERWVRSDFGIPLLRKTVAGLRCGLDDTSWRDTGRNRCMAVLGLDKTMAWKRGSPLPFDLTKAYELYKNLFGDVEDMIKDKHLLLVLSDALTSLPFQILVTAPPAGDGLAQAAWLIREHALTVLPSVSSLAALRRNAKASAAREPFIGFGNPVLSRSCSMPFIPDKCPEEETEVAAVEAGSTRGLDPQPVGDFFRGGLADVAALKSRLCPLPDTVHELTCVAKSLGADPTALVLGKEMTETAVKSMPLDRYRIVHFATHGLLAGETARLAKNNAEPALVFSPPETATEKDDGLLTASEVAGLKLDADWVVMSACNTASGAEPGDEALTGLAKAFFYAGARALLVSHWPVNSYAATILTSRTFAEIKRNPSIGRSEAFRRAMLALISDKDRPWAAHPSVWAPFVVVGEGGVQASR